MASKILHARPGDFRRERLKPGRIARNAGIVAGMTILGLGAVFMLIPFVWTALTGFKTFEEIYRFPITWLPDNIFNFTNYGILLADYPSLRWFGNSVLVSLISIVSSVILCAISGYAFAKLRFRGRELAFAGVLALLIMPFEITFLPLYLMMSRLHLVNTYPGIVGPNFMSALGIFIMRQFIQGIPDDYIHAARVDGASEVGILWHIILRLSGPAIATLVVLKFILSWNDFLWPLVMAQTETMMTLTVGMQTFITGFVIDFRLLSAAATISVLPMIVLFVLAQRRVINAMIMSGLK